MSWLSYGKIDEGSKSELTDGVHLESTRNRDSNSDWALPGGGGI